MGVFQESCCATYANTPFNSASAHPCKWLGNSIVTSLRTVSNELRRACTRTSPHQRVANVFNSASRARYKFAIASPNAGGYSCDCFVLALPWKTRRPSAPVCVSTSFTCGFAPCRLSFQRSMSEMKLQLLHNHVGFLELWPKLNMQNECRNTVTRVKTYCRRGCRHNMLPAGCATTQKICKADAKINSKASRAA